jgi:hypothetical protein
VPDCCQLGSRCLQGQDNATSCTSPPANGTFHPASHCGVDGQCSPSACTAATVGQDCGSCGTCAFTCGVSSEFVCLNFAASGTLCTSDSECLAGQRCGEFLPVGCTCQPTCPISPDGWQGRRAKTRSCALPRLIAAIVSALQSRAAA